MKPRRDKPALIALAAGLVGLAIAIPALGQNGPESLLPPGFGEPPPAAPPVSVPTAPVDDLPGLALTPPDAVPAEAAPLTPEEEAAAAAEAAEKELPGRVRRSIDLVGPLGADDGGLDEDAFGHADGNFLRTLMRRVDAPVASRWASILLRRALLSRVPTPRATPAADWVADRAWLLLRMGEADAARLLIQSVDVDQYSPRLYAIAAQTALATADPAALCPIADTGGTLSDEPIWPLAQAICAGFSGDAGTSAALIDHARQKRIAGGVDLLLAEKLVGAGTNSRRAVTIDWSAVDHLTAWRFGMANALGVAVPDALYGTVGSHVQAWRAQAPMLPLGQRIGPARIAAALGVMSSAGLVDLYGALADDTDPSALAGTPMARLRTAYVAEDMADRVSALRSLWPETASSRDCYAGMILTARAAARIVPDDDYASDATGLIEAMFSAGFDRQAARWSEVVRGMGGSGDRAWALLSVGVPHPTLPIEASRIEGLNRRRAQLTLAALAGLGRLGERDVARLAASLAVPIGLQNHWTRAIDVAGRARAPGTVAVLAAAGLQTRDWRGVPAVYLYHIVAALRASGQEPIARMIAAEALSRS